MPLISEAARFFASALVLLAFAMKDMRMLRIIAIFSNVAFIAYGALDWLPPVLSLHLLLLPLNLRRLKEAQNRGGRQVAAHRELISQPQLALGVSPSFSWQGRQLLPIMPSLPTARHPGNPLTRHSLSDRSLGPARCRSRSVDIGIIDALTEVCDFRIVHASKRTATERRASFAGRKPCRTTSLHTRDAAFDLTQRGTS
jgi:hypothetical protein